MNVKVLRVLIIATQKFELDGITNVILNYYRSMDKEDMQIDFVIPNELRTDLKLELESNGSRIFVLKGRTKNPFSYVVNLTRIIQKHDYNIVHAHGNSYTLALEMYSAKKAGAKVRIPHCHSTKTKYKMVHLLLRNLFKSSYTHGFACGKMAGNWLYEKEPFEIINNGIDLSKYCYNSDIRKKYRTKYNLKQNKVIGHVGHFNYAKNHEYLIDIFSELIQIDNNYRLMLIGEGNLRDAVEEKVRKLGLSNYVIFMGKTLEVPQLMQAMDLIVMPSRFEGLPLTLVEAQASILTCFVSDRISREVGITNLVNFIPLDKGPKDWANIIHNSKNINRDQFTAEKVSEIINAGFSINENSSKMKQLYKQFIDQGKV